MATAWREGEAELTATFDLDATQDFGRSWGTFRDRNPILQGALRTMDGVQMVAV